MFMNSASGVICGQRSTTKYTECQAFCPVVRIAPPLPTKGQKHWYSVYSTLPTLKSDILILKGGGGCWGVPYKKEE